MRICLSKDISPSARYATLSHCWGSKKYLCLTKNNLDTFLLAIPVHELSQTVVDAIWVARSLGFAYLWIDTLCIIQDDLQDWAWEASAMSFVYSGADLNIAASGARDGSEGCFYDQPGAQQCDVDIELQDGLQRHQIVPSDYAFLRFQSAPLLRRGWVLQERLLSRRTLHFTRSEVHWECYDLQASETFPHEIPAKLMEFSRSPLFKGEPNRKLPLGPSQWAKIVQEYSNCQLTYAKDKLVAISGLVQHIQLQLGESDEYYAGVWETDLEKQLCWHVVESLPPGKARYAEYIAPTWSWASVAGPVNTSYWDMEADSFGATVLRVEVQRTNDDYSAILNAKLYMRCKVLVRLEAVTELGVPRAEGGDGRGIEMIPHGGGNLELSTFRDQIPELGEEGTFALPLLRNGRFVLGILVQTESLGKGVYTRVGHFECFCEEWEEVFGDGTVSFVDEKSCSELRLDEDGQPSYVIEII